MRRKNGGNVQENKRGWQVKTNDGRMAWHIVVQMVFGSLGAVRTYAGDTIYKVITVSEKEIIKGVKRAAGKDHEYVPNIDRKKLPYANEELKDDAIDKLRLF